MFFEGGRNLANGSYIYLDPISMTKYLDGEMVMVFSGNVDTILDDIKFVQKYWRIKDVNLKGIIRSLKESNIRSKEDMTIKKIGEANKISPIDVYG